MVRGGCGSVTPLREGGKVVSGVAQSEPGRIEGSQMEPERIIGRQMEPSVGHSVPQTRGINSSSSVLPRTCPSSGSESGERARGGKAQIGQNFACSSCNFMCRSKMGLSWHERRVHAADCHCCLTIGHCTGNKCRCTHEERVLLAQEEVCICGEGMSERSVNSRLSLVFLIVLLRRSTVNDGRQSTVGWSKTCVLMRRNGRLKT